MRAFRILPAPFTRILFLVLLGLLILATGSLANAAPPAGHTRYLVIFHADARDVNEHAQALANGAGRRPDFVYTKAIKGFAVSLPNQSAQAFLEAMRRNPLVDYIEEDQPVAAQQVVQYPVGWGLDRIDQRDLAYNTSYAYAAVGQGVRMYIVDTGVRVTHEEFTGRTLPGYTVIADGNGTNDCAGHGTQVAGIAAGTVNGVAKGALIVPVRVFDCASAGSWAGVVSGLDWIAANVVKPAVVNMSLSGGISTATDSAVANLISQGMSVVVAAGNENVDACLRSPGRVASAVTVGATRQSTLGDPRYYGSNWGKCVDLFAPGVDVSSAAPVGDVSYWNNTGTSFSAPYVAGHLAALLEAGPTQTPAQLASALAARATPATVTSAGADSPLLMLYNGSDSYAGPSYVRVSNMVASKKVTKASWNAMVDVTVRDMAARVIAGATVTGQFTTASGTVAASCVTATTGICQLKASLPSSLASSTFSVTGVAGGGTYLPGSNFASSVTLTQ